MIAVSMCSIVMGTSGMDWDAVLPGRCLGVTQMPEEHQSRCDDVEGVQGPDRAGWQLHHIDAVDSVADVGQHQVSPAVGRELLGACCLDQHGQGAHCEEDGRHRSCENCHACHAEDATEDGPWVASGQIPNLQMGLMGGFPYAPPS